MLVVACCTAILVLALVVGLVVSAVRGVAQARSAADLSALAAAGALIDGMRPVRGDHAAPRGSPCALAEWVAARNGAHLQSCTVDAGVNVTVSVAVPVAGGGPIHRLRGREATAAARAGPAPLLGEPEPLLGR